MEFAVSHAERMVSTVVVPSAMAAVEASNPIAAPLGHVSTNLVLHRSLSWLTRGKQRWAFVGVFLVFVIGMGVQIGADAYYGGRIMPGVTIDGMNLSGLTQPQAHKLLAGRLSAHRIELQVGSTNYHVTPAEIGVVYDIGATVEEALAARRSAPVAFSLAQRKQASVVYHYHVDQTVQSKFVEQVVKASGQAPIDASITFKQGEPIVQADKNGQALNSAQVTAALKPQLQTATNTRVVLKPTTQIARVRQADAAPAVEATKQLLAVPVVITFEGRQFAPSASQKADWIGYDPTALHEAPGLKPKVNPDGVRRYLKVVAKQTDVSPINKMVNVQNGVSQDVRAGQDGRAIDQDALVGPIVAALNAKQAISLEATAKPVPFSTQYNNSVALPFAKYIEINLSKQHVWVYQDHQVVHDAPITSGAAGAGFPTITGQFAIQAKQRDRYLNGNSLGPGYNYNVFVHYWMPFAGNFGLHDASWRRGVFGGQDYYYGGSHGCVNLPDGTAAWIFNWADVGTPVWVHQ